MTTIDYEFRGFPATGIDLDEVGAQGWNALRAPMMLPLLVLKNSALQNNLREMADYCARHGLLLAPHGKTHMSPALWQQQLAHGAWAVTVANAYQAEVYRRHGARRILIANEVVGAADLDWLIGCRERDPECEVLVVVDSLPAVDALAARFDGQAGAPQPVLLELGAPSGRAGVRDLIEARAVAERVAAAPGLVLRGIEGFEGAVPDALEFLRFAREVALELHDEGLLDGHVIITFGGSKFFGQVADVLSGDWPDGLEVDLVIRSGCYLTHDHGQYAEAFTHPELFPDGDRPALEPALEVWGTVLSVPERGRAIVGFGRRDVSFDGGLPVPLTRVRDGAAESVEGRLEVAQLNDQHAFVNDAGGLLRVGDSLGCGISHPCTTFDKWRLVPVVDDDYDVIGAVRTFF